VLLGRALRLASCMLLSVARAPNLALSASRDIPVDGAAVPDDAADFGDGQGAFGVGVCKVRGRVAFDVREEDAAWGG